MITPEQQRAIARNQLMDCMKQLGERAEELGEKHIAVCCYTLGGCIQHGNDHQFAEICGTFAQAMKDALPAKPSTQS